MSGVESEKLGELEPGPRLAERVGVRERGAVV
jgi:hypothetical protein